MPDLNKIYRSKDNRIIAGVCGGLGEYFKVDPVIVRLVWIFASFASVGLGILVYVVLVFIFPEATFQKADE
ncbi:MAG: PspC domain-containing protein [Calditrichae bacterium]|nr:PspC domain-containing protein [Calditrichia bacterium]